MQSIEKLYQVFSKIPLKEKIHGCPCCSGKIDEQALHSKSLRTLSGADLSLFGFKAMSTMGDAKDFKHFLPRLFELVVLEEFEYNEEILFRKLEDANWKEWNSDEKYAIENFFYELFRVAINYQKDKAYLAETYLIGIACVVDNITTFLNLWLEDISVNKIFTLKHFIIDCNYGLSNSFFKDKSIQQNKIRDWLTKEKTISTLEKLFFQDKEYQGLTELSEILETIYELQTSENA